MKIGVIGLGGIAQKAYLPVMAARSDIELVLCTRNRDTLNKLSKMYRISETAETVEELLQMGIDAAFIHSATESHVEIAEKLLNGNVHVYVDKPLDYSYEGARKIVELAEKKDKILMTGFNRRFSPMYKNLKDQESPNLILMQKNRTFIPDISRRFIFDDFVHVVDTLRFLSPGSIEDISVKALKKEGLLYSVVLQLSGNGFTAIGIMNRDSGINEETLEIITPGDKWVVRDLTETLHYFNGEQQVIKFNDWDPVLYRRGFYQITDHFINCVKSGTTPSPSGQDSLITHELLEKVVNEIEENY